MTQDLHGALADAEDELYEVEVAVGDLEARLGQSGGQGDVAAHPRRRSLHADSVRWSKAQNRSRGGHDPFPFPLPDDRPTRVTESHTSTASRILSTFIRQPSARVNPEPIKPQTSQGGLNRSKIGLLDLAAQLTEVRWRW